MTGAGWAAILGAVLLHPGASVARVLEGTVVRVTDGDSVWFEPAAAGSKPIKLRLRGIDAPEACQRGGPEARAALAARVLNRRVQATTHAIDDYRRTVATLRLNGEDIGAWMVLRGHAWSDGHGHVPGPYASQQTEARAARRGVFADPQSQMPREFRRQHGPCP